MVDDFTPEDARRRMIRRMRLDAEDEGEEETQESEGGESGGQAHYGNTRLPYGLCRRFGIDLPDDATPREAWNALEEGTGYSHDEVMEMVKKAGSAKDVQTKKGGESVSETTSGKGDGARPKGAGVKDPKSMRGMGAKEHKHFDSIYAAGNYLNEELGIPVDYAGNGMDAEKANKFNDAILTVADELGIKPNRVQTPKKGKRGYMSIEWFGWGQKKGALTFNICNTQFRDWESDPEKWHSDRVSCAESAQKSMEACKKYGMESTAKKKERDMKSFQKSANYRAWRMGGGGKDFETAVFHEMGHVLMSRVGDSGKTNVYNITGDAYLQARKKKNKEGDKDIYKISEYAGTSQDEFFAECFAGYMAGIELPDYCNEMVENMIGELGKLREGGYDDFKGTWNDAE